MPLTQPQIDALNSLLGQVSNQTDIISHAIEDCQSLLRINDDISNPECLTILQHAKQRAKAAADALSALLA